MGSNEVKDLEKMNTLSPKDKVIKNFALEEQHTFENSSFVCLIMDRLVILKFWFEIPGPNFFCY